VLREIANLKQDGECITHGPDCDGTKDDCQEYVMECDDAIDTLNRLIATARTQGTTGWPFPGDGDHSDERGNG
jgi:hypothetical protein